MSPIAHTWSLPGVDLSLDAGVLVGILNVTPDSFSDGGRYLDLESALAHARSMVEAGAAIIDVGGESTRPGAAPVEATEELARLIPVVSELVSLGVPMSVDTYKPEVAAAAIDGGASIVNDVTGFVDPGMAEVAASNGCGVVIMHGRDADLASLPEGTDVVALVERYLLRRVEKLATAGVDPTRIVIDPGLGFGKRPEQSVALLAGVARLASHGLPVMVGASRKGFIREVSRVDAFEERDTITAAITAVSYFEGARLFRVHDVARSRGALKMAAAIVAGQ